MEEAHWATSNSLSSTAMLSIESRKRNLPKTP